MANEKTKAATKRGLVAKPVRSGGRSRRAARRASKAIEGKAGGGDADVLAAVGDAGDGGAVAGGAAPGAGGAAPGGGAGAGGAAPGAGGAAPGGGAGAGGAAPGAGGAAPGGGAGAGGAAPGAGGAAPGGGAGAGGVAPGAGGAAPGGGAGAGGAAPGAGGAAAGGGAGAGGAAAGGGAGGPAPGGGGGGNGGGNNPPIPPAPGDLFGLLGDEAFNIETPVSTDEADAAVDFFAIATIMQAGLNPAFTAGGTTSPDLLGMRALYFGLQDNSLNVKLPLRDVPALWTNISPQLKSSIDDLDKNKDRIDFVRREAKRQFNLGTSNDVIANTEFPTLFRRLVEIASDARLAVDLRAQDASEFSDKAKVEEGVNLLGDLRDVVIRTARSLSKYGSIATKELNDTWRPFTDAALRLLKTVADNRVSSDSDDKFPWATLAILTDKNRERDIAPYAVLARNGRALLRLVMETYGAAARAGIDNADRGSLLDLFQPLQAALAGQPADKSRYVTSRMREHALVLQRYMLADWR